MRVAGWSALAFALIPIAVLVVPHSGIDELGSTDDAQGFLLEHWAMQQWQPLMHAASALAFIVLVVALEQVLAGRSALVARLMLVTGSLMAAVWLVAMGLVSVSLSLGTELATPDSGSEVLVGFYQAGWALHFRTVWLAPVFLGCAAWLALREPLRWRTWSVITAGLALISAAASVASMSQAGYVAQFPAFLVLIPWGVGTGIFLLVRAKRA